jgi:hypothetical protein
VLAQRVAAVVGATAFVVGTPAIAGAVSGDIDLTPGSRESVSAATRGVLDHIGNRKITLTAFSPSVSLEASRARATVRKYAAAGANIDVRIIDPDISPALARSSGVIDYNDYLIAVDGKTQELDDLAETFVTTAIASLSETDPPLACFIQGHGERRINDVQDQGLTSFTARLRIIGYKPAEVFLTAKGAPELLKQCDVVLLMGPRTTMPARDLQLLVDYLKTQGRRIVEADTVRGDIPQL